MAKIHGDSLSTLRWLSLSPVQPSEPGADATEYLLEFASGAGDVAEQRRFSVADRLNRHTSVWLIARLFAEARQLLRQETTLDLWRIGKPYKASIYKSCDWLSVAAWGIRRQQKLRCAIFVQEGMTLDLCRRFALQVTVEEAEQFGIALEQEIIAASPKWWAEGK